MLLTHTHTNIMPQKCSVHKIITGFIKNINSCALQAVWSRARRACANLLLPSRHMPPEAVNSGLSWEEEEAGQLAAGRHQEWLLLLPTLSRAPSQVLL